MYDAIIRVVLLIRSVSQSRMMLYAVPDSRLGEQEHKVQQELKEMMV
jgi:hypothetical protein